MDAFSSSLFPGGFHPPKPRLTHHPSPHIFPFFTGVSSVRIEEKHQPQPHYPSTPPPSIPTAALEMPFSSTAPWRVQRVQSKPKRATAPSVTATLCNAFEDIIVNFIDTPLRPSVDPKHVLADNFLPVSELPPTECPVVHGSLPRCLDGAYIRNGPNPQFLPRGSHHLFDGDGMLHSLRITYGRPPAFCSRFVKTYKFTTERNAGSPIFPNVFSGFHGMAGVARGALTVARVLTGQFNLIEGAGLANTSLAFFGDRLFALGESDLPYAVRLTPEGDIQTVGRCDFEGKLFLGMTAHPKLDPDTGEVFAFRYGPVPPFLTFFRLDASGVKQPDVPIFSMMQPSFVHDFAITKRHAIFPDIQIVMKPMDMILGEGSPVGSDPSKVPRIGVIPRYAADESSMRWFQVPGFNFIHTINAWDEGDDEIVLIAANTFPIEHVLERMDLVHCCVEKVRINLVTGTVSRRPLSAKNLEFGVINPSFLGKKSRYAYVGVGDPMPKISGLVKLDLEKTDGQESCVVGSSSFGEGCFGGEPFFVARDPDDPGADEDDGYVVTYTHDDNSGESRFLVMDARSPTLQIVAAVELPQRVPYGFHGLFVRERDLRKHAARSPVFSSGVGL